MENPLPNSARTIDERNFALPVFRAILYLLENIYTLIWKGAATTFYSWVLKPLSIA